MSHRASERGPRDWWAHHPFLVAGAGAAALLTLGVVGVFFAQLSTSGVAGFKPAEGGMLLPGLRQRVEEVSAIQIKGQNQEFTLRNTDGTWRLASRDGYPARASRIDEFLERIANLRTAYVSEQEQPPYEEYGVAEPDVSASQAVKVTLRNDSDDTLERVIVGHTFSAPGGSQLKKVFIRRDGDNRVWLADSDLQVESDPLAWLDREIVHVPHRRVTEVVTVAPQGERLAIRRSDRGDLHVAEGLPPGENVRGPWLLNTVAAALEGLKFEDVRAAGTLPRRDGEAWHSLVRTADGLTYRIELLPRAEQYWALFRAEAEAPRAPARGDSGGGEPAAGAAPPEAEKEAQRFNARHAGWAYRMPPYSAERLTTRARDLTD